MDDNRPASSCDRLESVRSVVQFDAEYGFNEAISQTIQAQLEPRIIDDAATFDEATSKHAIKTLIQQLPIADYVSAIIRLVSHHDDYRVPAAMINSPHDGSAKTMLSAVLERR